MQMVLLDENKFDEFAYNHPNKNFYQTSSYGKMMSKQGHNSYYLGLVDDFNNVKAATLLIVKNETSDKRKMGYAPRGFLIDWNDTELVQEFTESLKSFLLKRNFTYVKVDPLIIYKEYNVDLEVINEHSSFVSKLQNLGYVHLGYNDGQETNNLRWNSIVKLSRNSNELYSSLSIDGRRKIVEANYNGNRVYKGNKNDFNMLFQMKTSKSITLDYLLDYYQFFSNNIEVYFTKFEPVYFVNKSKSLYEKEEIKNQELNNMLQTGGSNNVDAIINQKLESDKLLNRYKADMQNAIASFQKYPSGIITSGIVVMKYDKTITVISSAVSDLVNDNISSYLLKWQLIQKYANEGYEIFDFNGMVKDYKKSSKYIENVELSNTIVEYVGEFDLVINKKSYYTGSKLNPIINWLNTPI